MKLLTEDNLITIEKDEIPQMAQRLDEGEIARLVEWLSLKDDTIRYNAFLLLQQRSRLNSDVYPYWDVFQCKLRSENSYQRSLGIMMIAENVKWDSEGKMKDTLNEYLENLYDEKMVTVRQCIQSLKIIVQETPVFNEIIANSLMDYNIMFARETMRKSILLDIIYTLIEIRKSLDKKEITEYVIHAISGGILDKKSKKIIGELL